MNYQEEYDKLIATAVERNWSKKTAPTYTESHHITPKCLGGSNEPDNLVVLTAQEHYEAHRLLALENPNHQGLVHAWWRMCNLDGRKVSKEEYAECKKALITVRRAISEEDFKTLIDEYNQGEPMYKLALKYGLADVTIANYLILEGVPVRSLKEINGGLSDRDEDELVSKYLNGVCAAKLATDYGFYGNGTVLEILKRRGIPIRSIADVRSPIAYGKDAEICEKYQRGISSGQLAKEYQCSDSHISNVLKRNGVKSRDNVESKSSGLWYVPHDDSPFKSARLAGEAIGLSKRTVLSRCQKPDHRIPRRYFGIPAEYVGKTWRELGYWFDPKAA